MNKPELLNRIRQLVLIWLLCHTCIVELLAQNMSDTEFYGEGKITQKNLYTIKANIASIETNIDQKTEKYVKKLQKTETSISRKLRKIDSLVSNNLLINSQKEYTALISTLENRSGQTLGKPVGEYLPYLDSLKGSLSFLQKNKEAGKLLQQGGTSQLGMALQEVNQLQGKLQEAEIVKKFIAERKQQLKEVLSNYTDCPNSIKKSLESYNKQAYYYAEQIRDYKEMLNNPDKVKRKALSLLNQLPAFQDFMKVHSELGGLFSLPGNYGITEALEGLQTKDQVQQLITNQLGDGANTEQLLGQMVQTAQQGLNQLKNKLTRLGDGSGDIEMPDFKINQQKTIPFIKRLEYGTNLQTQRSGYFFPATTDLALSVGYKLTNTNVTGIGVSYKLGWGKDIQHIAFSNEGIGLRSFADIQIHKSFYVSTGFEYNYLQPFSRFQQINSFSNWSQSGLMGVSKIVSMKTTLFKKTKLQLLWDFLSYHQRPATQQFKFRIGYNF